MARHRKAQQVEEVKKKYQQNSFAREEAKLAKRQGQDAIARSRIQERPGDISLHDPFRVRSLRKKKETKKDRENSVGKDPNDLTEKYNMVKCTVEWLQKGSDNIKLLDSRIPYGVLREKAPELLCDFFERHIEFYDPSAPKKESARRGAVPEPAKQSGIAATTSRPDDN